VKAWQKVRNWLKREPFDPDTAAAIKQLDDDKLTIRMSQWGRQPYMNIPPTPDVLDPDKEHR
jgi:hypothetical protein